MSEENVEIVRLAGQYLRESYRCGEPIAGLLDLTAPDVRVDASRRVFNPAVFVGLAGVRQAIREVHDAWDDFSETDQQLIDAGDRVVLLHTIGGRGRASKVEVEARAALIWTIHNGRIQTIETFNSPEEALEAVGPTA
ncbi:MAG TPA: nuclear transport factor 2 family protein [Solirubrobacteraceae bacterium]|jgi:ketosteroid isomerase-like protein|nr:nuclear transport factor 2 family protein [Solirubrobacteraceae bacterium]